MFSFDGHLVQVELGTTALHLYSSKDTRGLWRKLLGEEPPGWGDDLIQRIDRLQAKLREEDIYLPGVLISPAQELPTNCIRITFGVSSSDLDACQMDPIKALELLAHKYHPQSDLTEDWVLDQLFIALDHISNRKFQEAMNKLALVYYWSSLIDYPTVRVVALLNIGGLFLLNSRPDDAYISVRQAQFIVEKNNFHDPYLRFHTQEALAVIACLNGDYRSGGALYLRAADTIRPLDEQYFLVSALYHSTAPLMEAGEYQICRQVVEDIVSQISQGEENFGKDFWVGLFHLVSHLTNLTEAELTKENMQLQNQVLELQTKYNKLAKRTAAVEQVTTAVIQVGTAAIQYYMGALASGDKYYDQRTQNHLRIGLAEQVAITQISRSGSNYVN